MTVVVPYATRKIVWESRAVLAEVGMIFAPTKRGIVNPTEVLQYILSPIIWGIAVLNPELWASILVYITLVVARCPNVFVLFFIPNPY